MASTVKSGLQQQPSTKMCWWWTIRLIAVLLVFVQGGQTSNDDKESFDPWKESDRPKVVVDYFNGPLRGMDK
jgi:hypothetical protein